MKPLYGRVVIGPPSHEDNRLKYRKRRYERRMELVGIRSASIAKYLRRGFKSAWSRALSSEMERLVWDIKYRRVK